MTDSTSSFLCPIIHEIMTDPVIDLDGNSYERLAIENWLDQHSTSPITRKPLKLTDLRPNRALRETIEQYRNKQNKKTNISTGAASNTPSFELKLTSSWIDNYTYISIQPEEGVGIRAPCDICCVVDTSGSMGTEIDIQSANDKEKCGLSQLDIVKHALKTIIHGLTENDRLSILSFSDDAKILFKLRQMDNDGHSTALAALERLEASGQTNLWDGLRTGLEILAEGQRPLGSNVALFLLTDGCPNVEPPRGYLPTLSAYKTKMNFTCSINTFGFGYNLDSTLLEDISQLGNSGSYAFIPDGSFVGTIFINAITNLLTTVATNLQLTIGGIQPPINTSSSYVCHYATEVSKQKGSPDSNLCVGMGSVIFGQSKDLVLSMTKEQHDQMNLILDYESAFGTKKKRCQPIKVNGDIKLLNEQKSRLQFIYHIRQGYNLLRGDENNFNEYQQNVLDSLQSLEDTIKISSTTDNNYLNDLLADLTGQVKQAFSRYDWFKKWGIHYLPSLTRAHLLQQCNNFKDPGVQHYGQGQLFNTIRDEMDGIFCTLPAPKRFHPPSQQTQNSSVHTSSTQNSGNNIDMSVFNDADRPCFHGSCTVKLFDGSIKFVKDIQRGDQLYPHGGIVNYILRTNCPNKQAKMVFLDTGLIITPWHPIRLNDIQWIFPYSLVSSPVNIFCDAVYSFALNQGHTIWINDIECVTLGHQFKEDIVRHSYYGSQRIIEDLRILDGEQKCTGFIDIQPTWIVRNKQTGLVKSIRQPQNDRIITDKIE